jgi:hypothetical protein
VGSQSDSTECHPALKASTAFLKKRSKKLLIPLGNRDPTGRAPAQTKVFCGAFF